MAPPKNKLYATPDEAETAFYASPALVDGVAYVADTGGHLYALDADAGEERWRFVACRTGSWHSGATIISIASICVTMRTTIGTGRGC